MTSAPSASQKGTGGEKGIVTILLIVAYAAMWECNWFFVGLLIFLFLWKVCLLDTSFSWKKAALPFHFVRYCRLCGFSACALTCHFRNDSGYDSKLRRQRNE